MWHLVDYVRKARTPCNFIVHDRRYHHLRACSAAQDKLSTIALYGNNGIVSVASVVDDKKLLGAGTWTNDCRLGRDKVLSLPQCAVNQSTICLPFPFLVPISQYSATPGVMPPKKKTTKTGQSNSQAESNPMTLLRHCLHSSHQTPSSMDTR